MNIGNISTNILVSPIVAYISILMVIFGIGLSLDEKNIAVISNPYLQIICVFLFTYHTTKNILITSIAICLYYYLLYKSKNAKIFFGNDLYNIITNILVDLGIISDEDNDHF